MLATGIDIEKYNKRKKLKRVLIIYFKIKFGETHENELMFCIGMK